MPEILKRICNRTCGKSASSFMMILEQKIWQMVPGQQLYVPERIQED